jgi:thiol:disulfide interchange protein DsbD
LSTFRFPFSVLHLAASLSLAEPVRDGHVEAELLADVQALAPGTSCWVGIRFRIDPGWHTYWMNPGDTGMGPIMERLLPDGVQVGPLEWPCPEKIESPPSFSYGYFNEVVLPARLTVSPDFKAGGSVNLRCRVRWLVCRDACLPGRADIGLVLPLGPRAVSDERNAAALADARARVPKASADWTFQAALAGDRVILHARRLTDRGEDIRDIYFFPSALEVIDHGSPQSWIEDARGSRLVLKRSPYAREPPDRLVGVLRVNYDSRNAIAVDVPVKTGTLEGQ